MCSSSLGKSKVASHWIDYEVTSAAWLDIPVNASLAALAEIHGREEGIAAYLNV